MDDLYVTDDDSRGPLASRVVWWCFLGCVFGWAAVVYLAVKLWRLA